MKPLLAGFALGLLLNPLFSARAQQDIHSAEAQAAIPTVEFTLPLVLTVLAEYDVVHLDMPVAASQVWGRTDLQNRRIYIYRSSLAEQRSTVVHEIVHILYAQRGLLANEERVLQDEYRIVGALFGGKP
jgi:hypothetical protein